MLPSEFRGKVALEDGEWKKKRGRRISYSQDWPSYNMAQVQEKLLFYRVLNDAVDYLEIKEKFGYRGKPRMPMRDIVKSAVVKVFCGFSLRRIVSELRMMKGLGYIKNIPSYNCLSDAFQNPELEKHLANLYHILSMPLKGIDHSFSIDATGFSTTIKTDWVSERFSFKKRGKWKWKKMHALCGNDSNIIVSAKITKDHAHDSPQFQELLGDAARNFKIGEVCGDSSYTSKNNVNFAVSLGAIPFLKPRKDFHMRGRGRGPNWARMLRMWKDNQNEFKKHYHQRSNIEASFSSLKRKFGSAMRNRKDQSQRNELYAKIVCYNGSVLVNSIFELGIELNWN